MEPLLDPRGRRHRGRELLAGRAAPSGSAGSLRYRNSTSSGRTYSSSSASLTRHASAWSNGTHWGAQTASVFADAEPDPVPTPTPTPTSTPVATPTSTPTGPATTTPQNVRASVENGRIVVRWSASADPSFSYFAVRHSTDPNADKTTWTRLPGNHTSPTVTDSGLAAGALTTT